MRVTYDELSARGQMSKRSVKLLLDVLGAAGAVRYERVADPERGAAISVLHLEIQDGAWTPITVAMAHLLAGERPGGHLLRDLGLIVVLLEFCAEQRAQLGGLRAEVTRSDIAARSGLTVDRVDDCNQLLEQAGVLEIDRRRAANGGRHLASLYTIIEASDAHQGGEPKPAGRQNGTGSPEDGYRQGGAPVLPAPPNGTGRAEDRNRQGGDSATAGTRTPGSYTGARHDVENVPVENGLTPSPRNAHGPTGANGAVGGGERSRRSRSCARRCSPRGRLPSATAPARASTRTGAAGSRPPGRCWNATRANGSSTRSPTWSPTRSSDPRR